MIWQAIEEIFDESEREGYLVGGFLRDSYLGRPVHDLDIIVPTGALEVARSLADRLGGSFVVLDAQRQTGRVVCHRQEINVIDIAEYQGNSLEVDLLSRDLTINALALPINRANLVDLATLHITKRDSAKWQRLKQDLISKTLDYSDGLADLDRQIIRLQAERVILADPVRMLRAVRLAGQLAWPLEHHTKQWIIQHAGLLSSVAPERVRDEIFTVLALSNSAQFLQTLVLELGILQQTWPETILMEATEQNHHHAVNVWIHSLKTYECIERILNSPQDFPEDIRKPLFEQLTKPIGRFPRSREQLLKWTALFHDVGKTRTQGRREDGRITFYGHEQVGGEMIVKMAQNLMLSKIETQLAHKLDALHMRSLQVFSLKQIPRRARFRLFRYLGEEALEVLLLALADMEAKLAFRGTQQELEEYREFIFSLMRLYISKPEVIFPPKIISGKELISLYPHLPKASIGKILNDINLTQGIGKITNRDEGLAWLVRYIAKRFPVSSTTKQL